MLDSQQRPLSGLQVTRLTELSEKNLKQEMWTVYFRYNWRKMEAVVQHRT